MLMPTLTVTSDCLLSEIDLALEKELKRQLTIANPQYLAAKKYGRWIGKKIKPELKYYEPVPGGLRFPRGFSNEAVQICQKLTGARPQILDKRRSLSEVEFTFHGVLRPYQQQALEAIGQRTFGVLEAGTGSGKTVIALAAIARRRQPTIVIVHTKELLYQWLARAQEYLQTEVGLIGDGHFDVQPLTIAIVNTARRRVDELVASFGHLIVDECHRVPASLFTDVVAAFDCRFQLGLSATAFRSDDGLTKLIYYYMGDRIFQVNQQELTTAGAIVRPKIFRMNTSFVYNYQGDYQALMKALTRHEGRNRQILADIQRVARESGSGTTLVVSDRVSHCQIFADALRRENIEVALLTGQIPPEERAAIVASVQDGRVQVLVSTLQLISEGFDCPGLTNLFLTTPITFEGRLVQVIGRIMRPAANKEARVFDYVDENVTALRRSAKARWQILSEMG